MDTAYVSRLDIANRFGLSSRAVNKVLRRNCLIIGSQNIRPTQEAFDKGWATASDKWHQERIEQLLAEGVRRPVLADAKLSMPMKSSAADVANDVLKLVEEIGVENVRRAAALFTKGGAK